MSYASKVITTLPPIRVVNSFVDRMPHLIAGGGDGENGMLEDVTIEWPWERK